MQTLTTSEAATEAGVRTQTICAWIRAGHFRAGRRVPGGSWRIDAASFREFLRQTVPDSSAASA